MKTYSSDVVVIGGGIIGTSIAYYLAKSGKDVILIEKNGIGCGTSSSCDGFMFLQSKKPGLFLELAIKSAEMYSTLSEELDFDVHYRKNGGLILIETAEQHEIMQEIAKKQRASGLEVDIIDIEETRKREPLVSDKLLGAVYSSMDGHVNPISVTLGFKEAAEKLGAKIFQESPVTNINLTDGKISTVITENNEISAEWVVNACGIWAPEIGKMVGLDIPIIPRRGHILVSEPMPPLFNHVMLCARYIAIKHNPELGKGSDDPGLALGVGFGVEQTDNGNLLISNSRDFAGYNDSTSTEVINEIAKYAVRFVPSLKNIDILRIYAGLRPYTADGLPIIGPVDQIPNLFMAAGHEGDGVALSPITGAIVAEYIQTGSSSIPLESFNLRRFEK